MTENRCLCVSFKVKRIIMILHYHAFWQFRCLLSLSGFFGMFGTFGRSSKQSCPPAKKIPEVPGLRSLELTGDLIGHSGAVQVQ